ncbi:MAG: hydroxymethylglutaryl-CoA lyase [Acidobacteria bacterium]|nr:hydroxymethylglutaryl-CoA lyase [Acidobacteriota bacterium]
MQREIKLIECPRDAWQGLKAHIPAAAKAEYLRALLEAGFRHIDAVSFVSPGAVPQMADSEDVLKLVEVPAGAEIIAIVVNERGVERAAQTGKVNTIGFPYSVSETFLRQNQRQTIEQAYEMLENIKEKADDRGLETVVYISMAFGNPYGDAWSVDEVLEAVGLVEKVNVRMISLADTVGLASAHDVAALVGPVLRQFDHLEIGVHLHSRRDQAAERILAAYDAGCRRFDSALAGLGGCPFAQDELVGNIPTESVLQALDSRGAELPRIQHLASLTMRANRFAQP